MQWKKRWVGLIVLFFSSIFVLILLSLFFGFTYILPRNSLSRILPDKNYRISTFDSSFRKSSSSVIELPRRLKTNEYLHSVKRDGSHYLVSGFGSNEYKCTGSCFCEDGEKRRSSSVLSKSLTFLLASVTSIVAIDVARNLILEKCTESFSENCENIRSNIDRCESVVVDLFPKDKIETIEEEEYVPDLDNPKGYICGGHCLVNYEYMRYVKQSIIIEQNRFMDDELATNVEEFCETLNTNAFIDSSSKKEAEEKFEKTVLSLFCWKHVRNMNYQFYGDDGDEDDEFFYDSRIDMPKEGDAFLDEVLGEDFEWLRCVSENRNEKNPSIECTDLTTAIYNDEIEIVENSK